MRLIRRLLFGTSKCWLWHKSYTAKRSIYGALSVQPNLVTMRFDTPLFQKLFTPETKSLSSIFKKYNHELRIAGGAVRDLLMDKLPEDLDFATTATPDEMKEMFTSEGIRMLHKKGEGHGTVTVRINDAQNYEITTLRVDLHTDGRHAEVAFTTNWELDAGRRDLTINAMFLSLDGILYDYFNGVEDLQKRCVKFVGEPAHRIQEDFLRILRYFRFYGRIALKPNDHDPETLKAIAENVEGLEKIAGERLWLEVKKILSGNFAKQITLQMINLRITQSIGLPTEPDVLEFEKVCERSEKMKLHPVTSLVALLRNEDEIQSAHSRLKFSKFEKDLAHFIMANRKDWMIENFEKKYQRVILESKTKQNDTLEWVKELTKYMGDASTCEHFRNWRIPKFPLNGHVLLQNGFVKGPKMSIVMDELKGMWIDSDFTLTQEELLLQADLISLKGKS